ncbi:Uncharacterized protein FWK35_00005785, partial [Aphis craccivora]
FRYVLKICVNSTRTFLVITFKLSNQSVCKFLCSHLHNISNRLILYTTLYVQLFAL